jgi:hypothetical protein
MLLGFDAIDGPGQWSSDADAMPMPAERCRRVGGGAIVEYACGYVDVADVAAVGCTMSPQGIDIVWGTDDGQGISLLCFINYTGLDH